MEKKKIIKRIQRRGAVSQEEKKRLQDIRAKVRREYPPMEKPRHQPAKTGIAACTVASNS
jgi:hypothetical protein